MAAMAKSSPREKSRRGASLGDKAATNRRFRKSATLSLGSEKPYSLQLSGGKTIYRLSIYTRFNQTNHYKSSFKKVKFKKKKNNQPIKTCFFHGKKNISTQQNRKTLFGKTHPSPPGAADLKCHLLPTKVVPPGPVGSRRSAVGFVAGLQCGWIVWNQRVWGWFGGFFGMFGLFMDCLGSFGTRRGDGLGIF